MPKILKISGQEIDRALRDVTRQYLVGDLQKPQALEHVPICLRQPLRSALSVYQLLSRAHSAELNTIFRRCLDIQARN
jgi:hypothetical protein